MINQRTFALGVIISVGLLSGCGASLDDKGASASLIPAKTATLPPGTTALLSQANSKWSDVSEPGNIVTASGFSSEAIFGQNKDTPSEPETDDSAAVKIAYDSSGNISGLSVINDNVNLTWNDGFGEHNRNSSLTVTDGDDADGMIYDPENGSNWNYQTMATWVQANEAAGGRIGAMSVGNKTAGTSIPSLSTAAFTGVAEGMYVTDNHDFYGVSSDATLVADFVNRSVTFATTNSKIHTYDTHVTTSKSDLDLTGTFSYSADNNTLTASSLSSKTSGWTGGTASAKFYGPNAEEIGGVFSIRGTGPREAYEGAFGAKR